MRSEAVPIRRFNWRRLHFETYWAAVIWVNSDCPRIMKRLHTDQNEAEWWAAFTAERLKVIRKVLHDPKLVEALSR